jgi:hypothetical protein
MGSSACAAHIFLNVGNKKYTIDYTVRQTQGSSMDRPPPALNPPRGAMYIDDHLEIPRRGIPHGRASEYIQEKELDCESRNGETKTSNTTSCITPPSANTNPSASRSNTRPPDKSRATREIGAKPLREIIIISENISVPTAISLKYGEDRQKVVKQALLDPYGDKGIYTGVVLRSTGGMPHGLGRMVYEEDGRIYEGDWYVVYNCHACGMFALDCRSSLVFLVVVCVMKPYPHPLTGLISCSLCSFRLQIRGFGWSFD